MLADIRYAFRNLFRSPVFTTVALASLALGIGANTAIFSLTDQLLFRSLPVNHPEQLVLLSANGPNPGSTNTNYTQDVTFSYPLFRDIRDRNPVFSGVLAHYPLSLTMSRNGRAESIKGELVSGNYFNVLGVRAVLGRTFTRDDNRIPGAHPVAILSYGFWQRRFASDPAILNRTIDINAHPMTIVGVAQPGFRSVAVGEAPDVFVPMMMKREMTAGWNDLDDRRSSWLSIFARLKPGVSAQQAAAGIAPLWHSILEEELKAMNKHDAHFRSEFLARHLSLLPGARGISGIRGQVREPLLVLMAMVGVVLLIACANVANLLIARAAGRQKEIAVRLAMGAGRWRIVRQLLVESTILALSGGALGLLFAAWTGAALLRFVPADYGLLNAISTNPDLRVVAFTFAVALLTGLLFGLAPALQSTRPDLAPVLKEQAAGLQGGAAQARLRKTLVVGQVALSLLLLIASGLFARSLYNLKNLNPGFRPDHLMTFSLNPALDGYDNRRMLSADARLADSIAGIPGVRAVSYAELGALTNNESGANITIEGYAAAEHEDMNIEFNWVGPAYFSTMGIPLIAGRGIVRSDGPEAPKVAVINESFARHFFGRDNPLGRLFCFGAGNVKPDIQIVGVVKDAKYSRLREKPMRFIYLPYVQKPSQYSQATFGEITFYIRTAQDPIQTASALRARVRDLDPGLPILDMKTMDQQIDESIFLDRFIAALSAAFGLLATMLAALGLYGVMAYIVARRTREIGIRMALGADRRNVLSLVMKEVAVMAAIGIAIAIPLSFLVARIIQSELYGVPGNDPLILTAAAIGVALIALLAGYLPALRATRVDPLVALRYE